MSYSVPVPVNSQDIDDRFLSLVTGAPHFEKLQRIVTYTITLEMMVNSLTQSVEDLARRSKSESAKNCYAHALEGLHAGLQHYCSGQEQEGQQLFMEAHNIFRSATNKGPRWKTPIASPANNGH